MKRPGRNAEEMRRRREGPRNKLLPVCCCCHRLRSRLIHDAYSIYTHILCNAQKRIRQEWKCAHKGYATTTNYVPYTGWHLRRVKVGTRDPCLCGGKLVCATSFSLLRNMNLSLLFSSSSRRPILNRPSIVPPLRVN